MDGMGWYEDAICPWVCARTALCRWGNLETPADRTSKQHYFFFPNFASSPGEDTYSRVSFELASKAGKAKQAIKEVMVMMDDG